MELHCILHLSELNDKEKLYNNLEKPKNYYYINLSNNLESIKIYCTGKGGGFRMNILTSFI